MKPRHWLVVSCVVLGFSNLFGQLAPAPTRPPPAINVNATTVPVSSQRVVTVTAPANPASTTVTPPVLSSGSASDARLINLSTRARVSSVTPLVTGFAISGSAPRAVLVRAVGPSLGAFGVAGTLTAPRLKLYDASGAVVLENAGWGGGPALAAAMATAGAFPFAADSADSAAVVTLAPGTYTVEVSDDAGRGGVVLAEIYDVDGTADGSRLVNVSTRNNVAAGGGEFISGFVIAGTMPRQFLLRGVGPGLAKFGVAGVLSDPVVAAFDSAGSQIAGNNNWSGPFAVTVQPANGDTSFGDTISLSTSTVAQVPASSAAAAPLIAAATATGAFGLDFASTDAALLMTLAPGAYTVQVTGASVEVKPRIAPIDSNSPTNGTVGPAQAVPVASPTMAVAPTFVPAAPGVALLEIYEVP